MIIYYNPSLPKFQYTIIGYARPFSHPTPVAPPHRYLTTTAPALALTVLHHTFFTPHPTPYSSPTLCKPHVPVSQPLCHSTTTPFARPNASHRPSFSFFHTPALLCPHMPCRTDHAI